MSVGQAFALGLLGGGALAVVVLTFVWVFTGRTFPYGVSDEGSFRQSGEHE